MKQPESVIEPDDMTVQTRVKQATIEPQWRKQVIVLLSRQRRLVVRPMDFVGTAQQGEMPVHDDRTGELIAGGSRREIKDARNPDPLSIAGAGHRVFFGDVVLRVLAVEGWGRVGHAD